MHPGLAVRGWGNRALGTGLNWFAVVAHFAWTVARGKPPDIKVRLRDGQRDMELLDAEALPDSLK